MRFLFALCPACRWLERSIFYARLAGRLSGIRLPVPVRFSGWPAGYPVSGFWSHLRQLLGCSAGIIYGIILVTPDSRHNRCALNFGTTRKDAQRLCLGAVSKNRPLCYTLCCTFRRCVVPQNCTIKTCILLYLSSVCNTFRLRRYACGHAVRNVTRFELLLSASTANPAL